MKRLFSFLLTLMILLSLCACQGNFGGVSLKEPVEIPRDGMIGESTLRQIKNENAIAVFVGTSGGFTYEWTIFGSQLRDIKAVNLGLQLEETAEGDIRIALRQTEAFGFSAALSVHLNGKWEAQSATAYVLDKAFASVSVTGSKNTILNLTLDGTVGQLVVRPDPIPQDQTSTENTAPSETPDNSTAATTQPETQTQPAAPTEPTKNEEKDAYLTDPVPEGKPDPVEPEDQEVNKGTAYTCTFSIECSTILNNLNQLDPEKLEMIPADGVILAKTAVTFYEGESVFEVLQRVCKEKGIHLEASWTPMYNSAYIEGIHNLYEFDCGELSGWMYRVNGWYPNYGCSRYQLKDGDVVEWRFTCDLGNDIGGGYAAGG